MITAIIYALSVAINAEFGESYEIYTESVEQGFSEPCFSIICLNPRIDQKLGKRYFRTNMFCVHYFPSSDEKRSECHSVAERLFGALEYITITGDLCRGTNMRYEISDDVLLFFVNYDLFVRKDEASEQFMESVTHDTTMKG
jgi:hypothetical protein